MGIWGQVNLKYPSVKRLLPCVAIKIIANECGIGRMREKEYRIYELEFRKRIARCGCRSSEPEFRI